MSLSQPNASKRRRFLFHRYGIRFFRLTFVLPFCVIGMTVVVTSGCGQIMIRQETCGPKPVQIMDDVVAPEIGAACAAGSVRDRIEVMKAKLEYQGERFHGGVGRCSEKLSECWYRSRIAQLAEKHREQKNAPPPPKFHPIPTHPALFPEKDEANQSMSNLLNADGTLEMVD